ncbi:autotransporter domain-containing protein [Agrobacterium sp. BA1120]|uniref:autotransporter outer membrane beta-barrel domain-containing protein n=1 Tax=Agrobacterium sp. BA1120 TaxID=3228927 RepID=UPI00336A00D6
MKNFTLPSGGPAKLRVRKPTMAAVFMTGVSAITLFAAMSVRDAAATDCTVSGSTISGQTDCTVTNSGELTSPEGGLKINQGSDGVTVNNESGGTISGTGGWSGIIISASDNTVINNAEGATISGEGSNAAGITVTDPDYSGSSPAGTIISNAGSITGEDAGIDLRYFYGASIVNQTTGAIAGGYGIYAYSSSGVLDVQNDGTITGDSDYGIYIANMSGANISNAGWIYGLNTGIEINGATEIAITNSGTISSNARAIYAGSIDSFSLINSGTISSTGTDDLYFGINLYNVNAATIVNSGTISSYLAGQDRGLRLNEVDDATIINSGSILGAYFGIEFIGNDSSATITNTGTISGGVFGIWANDTDLTLLNAGTISGGVRSSYSGSLNATNTGAITGGFDLAALNEAIISNSGTISGGILTGDVNTVDITNSGTISSGSDGVNATNAAFSLINSGTISGESDGVYVRESTASIINSGTISGVDSGIYLRDSALTITNTGTISGSDYGIYSDSTRLTITTSGTISGDTASILFSRNSNTLNILSGAVFDGVVDYDGTVNNTTNFGTGSYSVAVANYDAADNTINLNNSHQTLVLTDANTSSGTVNVVDVNSTSMDSAVRGYTNSVGNVLGSILSIDVGSSAGGSSDQTSTGALGYAEEKKPTGAAAAVQKLGDDTAVDRFGNLFWIRAFGGQTFDNARDTSSSNYGVAAGVDRQFDEGRFGVLAGYGRIINKADDGSGKTTGDTGFGGVYVRKDVGSVTLDASLIAGGIGNDSRREIAGSDAAEGSFTGWYVSPEIAISQKHEFAPGWTFTPSARLRYTAGFYEGYTETGSTQNISYEDRTSNTLEGILEGKITNRNELANGMKANVSFSAALVDTLNLGSSDMNASLSGTDFTVSAIGNRNLIGGRFGLSGDVQLSQQTTIYSGVTVGTYSSEVGSWSANAGVKVKF